MTITFDMLLRDECIDPATVQLVRHQDKRHGNRGTPYTLWRGRRHEFELYQSVQSRRVFRVGGLVASFVVPRTGETLFAGLYHVDAVGKTHPGTIDPLAGQLESEHLLYDMKLDSRLARYVGRLVIEWGAGFRSWVQRAGRKDGTAKAVTELRRTIEDEPFPGYFQFGCPLSEILDLPTAWSNRLRDARGVYVLTSNATRRHYVGSAAGKDGFYGRWLQHNAAGGDAKGLQGQSADYQVSILQVSAGFDSDEDILRMEQAWMRKLLSRSMGLNGSPATAVEAPDGPTGQPDNSPWTTTAEGITPLGKVVRVATENIGVSEDVEPASFGETAGASS